MWWIVTLIIVVANGVAIWKVNGHWKKKYNLAKQDYEREFKDEQRKWEGERTVFRNNIEGLMDKIQSAEITTVGMQQRIDAVKRDKKSVQLSLEKEQREHAETKREL